MADILVEKHGFVQESFAGALKDALSAIFGWRRDLLEGKTRESREWRDAPDVWWSKRLGIKSLTPRWAMQHMGTSVCRNNFHSDIWVASLENKLLRTKKRIVVSDVRFPNEVKAIKDAGGIVVRVVRGEDPDWFPIAWRACDGDTSAERILSEKWIHQSEWAWAKTSFDHIINNNHPSVEELHAEICAELSEYDFMAAEG